MLFFNHHSHQTFGNPKGRVTVLNDETVFENLRDPF